MPQNKKTCEFYVFLGRGGGKWGLQNQPTPKRLDAQISLHRLGRPRRCLKDDLHLLLPSPWTTRTVGSATGQIVDVVKIKGRHSKQKDTVFVKVTNSWYFDDVGSYGFFMYMCIYIYIYTL